jgi:HD-GYP domain-containing protein (c-di-GMP phosphodiesterase class II)
MSPQTESQKPEQPPRRAKRKIVYWFLLVLSTMGLLPLGLSAYKLIDYSREALVTSQQEVQLMIAAAVVRQLDASVQGLRAQVTRLAESAGASLRGGGGRAIDSDLLERLLGSEFLMLRYAPRAGPPAEARQKRFPADRIEAVMAQAARAALDGEAIVTDPIRLRDAGGTRTVLVVAVPVGNGRPAPAALAAVADFDSLWGPLVGGRRASYLIYALDPGGTMFAAQDEEGLLERLDYTRFGVVQEFQRMGGQAALTSEFTVAEPSGPVEYIASFDVTEQGWGIFVQLPRRQAYATVNQMVQTTLQWAGLAVGLALLLAYVSASLITRPIAALTAGAEAFARGELDNRVAVGSRNELGVLAETFNGMAQQLQSYIQRLSHAAQVNNELFMGTIKALAEAIDEKDPYTRGHSERVNRYAVMLAKQLGLGKKEIREVYIASLFHDIGKIGIEDKILRKPAVLTDEEYTIMKQHPDKGAQMLSKIPAMKELIPGMRFHHERWDGSGYPMGLKAEQIPLAARIVAVADAFDAMTTNRPYQKGMPFDKAIARLYELSDRAFDRRVVGAFAEVYKEGKIQEPQMAHEEQ